MFPASSFNYVKYCGGINIESFRHRYKSPSFWGINISYFYNFFFRKFRLTIVSPDASLMSFFEDHISNVFRLCSSPKMARVNARPYVAFMKNLKFFWDWAIAKNPRNSMATFFWPSTEKSISIGIFTSHPNPARFSFGYFFEENVFSSGNPFFSSTLSTSRTNPFWFFNFTVDAVRKIRMFVRHCTINIAFERMELQ